MDPEEFAGETPLLKNTVSNKIKRTIKGIGRWLQEIGRKLWPGAAFGAMAAVLVLAIVLGSVMATGLGTLLDITISIGVVGVASSLAYILVVVLLKLLKALPVRFIAALGTSVVIVVLLPVSSFSRLLLAFCAANGALLGFAFIHGIRRVVSLIIIILVVAADAYLIYDFLGNGSDRDLIIPHEDYASAVRQLTVSDPSLAGSYVPKLIFYGSGWDKRPEYGSKVSIKTPTVDVTSFLSDTGGVANKLRAWYWGFDLKHCPLNARVWYPEGKGPFPLVLIVHGNHQMEKYSDGGYDYLGKFLASRGYIFASVDENFLNGNWAKDFGQKENLSRGWILLKHLEQWRGWDSTSGNLFYRKVDMNNIVLIGHSRGGQAVAIADLINTLPRYYTDARTEFGFGFKIKGIVQIAPNDPYEPTTGHHLKLNDVNYLLLQGGYDGDVSIFLGDRQYNNIAFSGKGEYFKAAVYIYRANHGQFNTNWGRTDLGEPTSWLMNLKPIMDPADQEKTAKIYISAFLEAVVRNNAAYMGLFKDFRTMADKLPKDYYISQFQDSRFKPIEDFEEGLDVTKATMGGVSVKGENLKAWSVNGLVFRDSWSSPQKNNVVYLGWDRTDSTITKGIPHYTLTFTDDAARIFEKGKLNLVFSMCGNKDDSGDSLDISIELKDRHGTTVELPLSEFAKITPPLKARLGKYGFAGDFGAAKPAERVLQTFFIPIPKFKSSNSRFDPSGLRQISFVFDRSLSGEVAVDNIGVEAE